MEERYDVINEVFLYVYDKKYTDGARATSKKISGGREYSKSLYINMCIVYSLPPSLILVVSTIIRLITLKLLPKSHLLSPFLSMLYHYFQQYKLQPS